MNDHLGQVLNAVFFVHHPITPYIMILVDVNSYRENVASFTTISLICGISVSTINV